MFDLHMTEYIITDVTVMGLLSSIDVINKLWELALLDEVHV